MKKTTLNLYEQGLPPDNINNLWLDKDESTGEIKAIHRYNKNKGEWEPYLVSVDYLKDEEGTPEEGGGIAKLLYKENAYLSYDDAISSGNPYMIYADYVSHAPEEFSNKVYYLRKTSYYLESYSVLDGDDERNDLYIIIIPNNGNFNNLKEGDDIIYTTFGMVPYDSDYVELNGEILFFKLLNY